MKAGAPLRIAYVLKRFPRLSETFILDEMLGLEGAGFELVIYAFGHPGEKIVNPDVARLNAPVVYVGGFEGSFGDKLRIFVSDLANHISILTSHPGVYLANFSILFGSSGKRASLKNINYGIRIARDLEHRNVVHIHAGFVHSPARAGLVASKLARITFSMAGHAKDIYTSTPDSIVSKARYSEFILACSTRAGDELITRLDAGAGSDYKTKVQLIHHGVDEKRFKPLPGAHLPNNQSETTTFLGVGRLVDKKGYAILIKAFATVVQKNPGVVLRLIGDGPNMDDLRELTRDLGVSDAVTFLGSLTRDKVLLEMQLADVFVHPSIVLPNGDQDGIPNVVLEAMAVGLCVVGSDIEGICEVIKDGESGLLVETGDVLGLTNAMVRAADNSDLRIALGARAREVVIRNYSKEHAIREVAAMMSPFVSEHVERRAANYIPGVIS